jgi:hypothetical protein
MSWSLGKIEMSKEARIQVMEGLRRVLPVAVIILLFMWFSGQNTGLGGKQETVQWSVESHDRTNFPLVGKHRTVSCNECHPDGVFEGTPTACEVCHWERRQDDRYELRLGTYCADCHEPFTWKNVAPNKWNHEATTGYPLEGVHRTLDCVECHGERDFIGASVDCFGCHENDYRESDNPDHIAAGFSAECQLCHFNNNSWEGARFSHDTFSLTGQHTIANCSDCHGSGQYAGLPSDCVFCHQRDYDDTSDPDHRDSDFPTACEICHGTNANTWEGAAFTHSTFPLRGQHRMADCSDCHSSGQYVGLPSDCVFCHREDYNSTRNPNHKQLNYPFDCEACHGIQAITWARAKFNHDSFPLKGQHAVVDCFACHSSGQYEGLPSVCVFCHLEDYLNAKDPDHKQLGFHTDCEVCHGTDAVSWKNANLSHTQYFPLQGAHTDLDCSQCHVKNLNPPKECVNCHQEDYDSSEDPNHKTAGFPTDCEYCHYPSHVFWSQAKFDHSFPIESGKHSQWDCTDCHLTANYRDFSCINCHTNDKTRMDNKHRKVPGYSYNSQSCYSCHPQGRE